jgi:hypothetical protein
MIKEGNFFELRTSVPLLCDMSNSQFAPRDNKYVNCFTAPTLCTWVIIHLYPVPTLIRTFAPLFQKHRRRLQLGKARQWHIVVFRQIDKFVTKVSARLTQCNTNSIRS